MQRQPCLVSVHVSQLHFSRAPVGLSRPARALQPSEDEARVTDLKDSPVNNRLQQPQTIALFLETAIGPAKELPPINKNMILLFLKLYKPKTQTLRVSDALFMC